MILLFLFLLVLFPLGQIVRFQTNNGIAVTFNDLIVFLFVIAGFIANFRKIKKNNYLLSKPIIIFIIIGFISLIINIRLFSLNQIGISFLYLLRWIVYAGLYFIVRDFNQSSKKIIIYFIVLSGAVLVFFGYIQYFFYPNLRNLFYLGWDEHMYRMFSTFLDPNFCGAFFVLYLILIMGIFRRTFIEKRNIRSIFIGVLIALTICAIFLTYSRSALIMFLVSSISFLTLINKKKIILLIFSLLFLFFIVSIKYFYIENINLFRTVSSQARIDSAVNAVKIIKDHPLIGIGFNTYRYAQIQYGFREGAGAEISHADAGTDNSFLFILATTGIIGFLSYLYLWIKILRSNFKDHRDKKKNSLSIIILSSSIGLFVDALFINSLFYPFFMGWMWILIGLKENN